MSSTCVYNLPVVVQFVNALIPGNDKYPLDTGNIGLLRDGKLVGGVLFTRYTGTDICMHVAGNAPGWVTLEFIRAAFRVPFIQLGCRRCSGLVRTDNLAAQRFDEKLGFKREGVLRKADDDGCDLIIYGMLREECKWIKGEIDG
jgi:RimJ/RimL family protein N-acetyltransferase